MVPKFFNFLSLSFFSTFAAGLVVTHILHRVVISFYKVSNTLINSLRLIYALLNIFFDHFVLNKFSFCTILHISYVYYGFSC